MALAVLRDPVVAVLLLLLVALPRGSGRDVDYCYSEESDRYILFSSKTSYDAVRSARRGHDDPQHCTPLQLWWLNRHGTRYPGISTIKQMEQLEGIRDAVLYNHNKERTGRLCDADLQKLTTWRLRVRPSQDSQLTNAGSEELFLTARRLRERFPALLGQQYNTNRYQFRHSATQRTEESAKRFAAGLFNDSAPVHIPNGIKEDMLLQAYANCPAWKAVTEYDPVEYTRFMEGPLVRALVANVSSRLGYRSDLHTDDVKTIYDMCRYDKAWDVNEISPWCAAFSKDELMVLEYGEDLKYYYRSGYGNDLSVRLGCPLVKDLFQRFSAVSAGGGDAAAGIFYFAHSSTLHMLQARLGVFQDAVAPTANNYQQQRHRKWRVSLMGSFAANLGAVFYRCTHRGESSTQQVFFMAGEGPLDVQGCSVGLCTWSHVKGLLQPLAEQCNLDWCAGTGGGATVEAGVRMIAVLLALVVLARASAL